MRQRFRLPVGGVLRVRPTIHLPATGGPVTCLNPAIMKHPVRFLLLPLFALALLLGSAHAANGYKVVV